MSFNPIHHIARDIISAYDHNRNGHIELEPPQNTGNRLMTILRNQDERFRTKAQVGAGDRLTLSAQVFSVRDLLQASDGALDGKQDGKVTQAELETIIGTYDTDRDQQLESRSLKEQLLCKPKKEYEKYLDDYGERLTNYGNLSI